MATLYFHIPFCKRICSYCDFYKVGALELLPRVVESMHRELDERSSYLSERRLTSIYFGGGTPSLVAPDDIEQLINHAREIFDCSKVEEVTIEANPDDITEEYVAALKSTSVNRVSLGIQSFDDRVLQFMNRRHTGTEAEEAVKRLRMIGINNISIDLIFGIAGFGTSHLDESLQRAINLDVEHISAYHLTIEERTRLGMLMRKGEYTPISDEESEREFLRVHNALCGIGASNHSDESRVEMDFYATDPKAVDYLLRHEQFNNHIWECACGTGNLSKQLEQYGYNVRSTDLVYRGFGGGK